MRNIIITIMVVTVAFSCRHEKNDEQIREAVEKQLTMYPESTLQDVYKSFFQDYFGPEHMISDTTAAGVYLDKELNSFQESANPYYEPTGCNGNFYRVNLSVVKQGFIGRDVFFNAFLRSAGNAGAVNIETWKKEWKHIDAIIQNMNLPLENYAQDRANIFSLLEQGKYAVHHSQQFSTAYDPHYRIIAAQIFQEEILPHIPNNNEIKK